MFHTTARNHKSKDMEYTRTEKDKIAEELSEVLSKIKKWDGGYICNIIHRHKTLIFFRDEKPSPYQHKHFYDHVAFTGGYVWWNMQNGKPNLEERKILTEQRMLFLEYLIAKLKSNERMVLKEQALRQQELNKFNI